MMRGEFIHIGAKKDNERNDSKDKKEAIGKNHQKRIFKPVRNQYKHCKKIKKAYPYKRIYFKQ